MTITPQLVLLGTGCADGTPSITRPVLPEGQPERGHCAAVYTALSSKSYLIDAGYDIVRSFLRYGGEFCRTEQQEQIVELEIGGIKAAAADKSIVTIRSDLDGIILTHPHDDHIGGLPLFGKQVLRTRAGVMPVYMAQNNDNAPHMQTLAYVQKNFGFAFGSFMQYDPKTGAQVSTKLEAVEIPGEGVYALDGETPLRTIQARHGKENSRNTLLGLPGLVYATDISHWTEVETGFVESVAPTTVVLNLQCWKRPGEDTGDDNYPHMGLKQFLGAVEQISMHSPQTKLILSVHMQTAMHDMEVQKMVNHFRPKFNIRGDLVIQVGTGGMHVDLNRGAVFAPQVKSAASPVVPSSPFVP